MQEPSDQPEVIRSMTGGGFNFPEDSSQIWTLADIRRLIDARGGTRAVAAALAMDPRNMQRVYAGKRHCSPTLLRRVADLAEVDHGKA